MDEIREAFEEDWKTLPRREGNKRKALVCYRKTVGVNLDKKRPLFQAQVALYCRAVEGLERRFIKMGETFVRNWEDLEILEPEPPKEPERKSTFQAKRDVVDSWAEKRRDNGGESFPDGAQNFPELRGAKP